MAIIKYRVKTRGRPRELDTNLIYQQIIQSSKTAMPRLKEIRESTRGYRSERVLGSQTSLPDWVEESLDLLEGVEYGRELSTQEAVSIGETLKSLRELSSPQKRVYQRAIGEQLTQEYVSAFGEFGRDGKLSNFTQRQIEDIKSMLLEMTPQERQEFFLSRYYQDPKANGRYERVKNWATAHSGRSRLTYQESWSYLYASKIRDYIGEGGGYDI